MATWHLKKPCLLLKGIGVQELPSPKKVLVNFTQLGFLTDGFPMLLDGGNQAADYFTSFFPRKKEVVRGFKARFDLAQIVVAMDAHGL